MSSAKWRFATTQFLLASEILSRKPEEIECFMTASKLSTTRMKRSGESGHPCFRPLNILKLEPGEPLTMQKILEEESHSKTHKIHSSGRPLALINFKRNDQLTLSKAFSKSSFRMKDSVLSSKMLGMTFDECRLRWVH